MAKQVGPQECKPEHSLVPEARGRDEDIPGAFIRARGFGLRKAGYKTAADTSLRHHMKINLANRAVSI